MEVKVGIQNVAREIVIETNTPAAELQEALATALAEGGVLSLSDDKGRKVLIPGAKVAYLDLGTENARPVGFGALNN
ncbi:MAG: DUF3107 domain-containing protein [Propioniciclava sp.]|uniref:DUF3107 domain-containing protein n=1 Tax=Propioniciclava sp. TaxID=2038686 RepID=UPI0039E6623E